MDKPFEHVVIIGCGLLGASLGLALRNRGLARRVTGVGRKGSPSVEIAQRRGAIDEATDDAAAAVKGGGSQSAADLVVVCTPVRQFPETFRALSPALARGTIVTDVGSTKADVMRWADELLPAHAPFVGSHPMAGSEKSGPEAAREDLYEDGVCLVCKPARPDAEAIRRTIALWQAVGMRTLECTAEEHDAWVATVSHLPHAIASCLVNTAAQDPASLETAASGFIDTSRIASGDVTMWMDILMTNRETVVRIIDRFEGELSALKKAVREGDEPAIRRALTMAKETRDAFIERRRQLTERRAAEHKEKA